jgi:hypothetical protein
MVYKIEKYKPFGYNNPYLIFDSLIIPWYKLVSNSNSLHILNENSNFNIIKNTNKKILSTFPVVHNYSGTNIKNISYDNEKIIFPKYGEYYIHTNLSSFKILILDQNKNSTDNILNIFKFISGNCYHSCADSFNFYYKNSYNFEYLYQILFCSDQPLKIQCHALSLFLCNILNKNGYKSQLIELNDHYMMQVYFPEYKKYGILDPTHGLFLTDKNNNLLDIKELYSILKTQSNKIKFKKLINKKYTKKEYLNESNFYILNIDLTSDFSWDPRKDGNYMITWYNEFFNTKKSCINILKKFASRYTLYDFKGENELIEIDKIV